MFLSCVKGVSMVLTLLVFIQSQLKFQCGDPIDWSKSDLLSLLPAQSVSGSLRDADPQNHWKLQMGSKASGKEGRTQSSVPLHICHKQGYKTSVQVVLTEGHQQIRVSAIFCVNYIEAEIKQACVGNLLLAQFTEGMVLTLSLINNDFQEVQKSIKRPHMYSRIESFWSSVLDLVDVYILRLFVSSKSKASV